MSSSRLLCRSATLRLMTTLGILTATHGVTAAEDHPSNQELRRQLAELDLPVPHAHGFLQVGRHLQEAVATLNAAGVDVIVAVILYPPTTNKEVKKALMELGVLPGQLHYQFYPVATRARILVSRLMEAHPLLVEVMEDRLAAISERPQEEAGLFVIHGEFAPGPRSYNEGSMEEKVALLRARGRFADVRWAALHPEHRVLPVARELLARGLRLLVSHGFTDRNSFTERVVPTLLAELPAGSWRYNPDPPFPHPAMRRYILLRTAEALRDAGLLELAPAEARALLDHYASFQPRVTLPPHALGRSSLLAADPVQAL
ncbi:MAG: hypothetical protein K6U89_03145 [Chloroflexi bacterium]|nr:hypothetical protein [Chloroflexota bacterium]